MTEKLNAEAAKSLFEAEMRKHGMFDRDSSAMAIDQETGGYADADTAAMWTGFKIALDTSTNAAADYRELQAQHDQLQSKYKAAMDVLREAAWQVSQYAPGSANLLQRIDALLAVQVPSTPAVAEWTDAQCLEFLSVAFRHCEIKGDVVLDEIRQGVAFALAAAPKLEGVAASWFQKSFNAEAPAEYGVLQQRQDAGQKPQGGE